MKFQRIIGKHEPSEVEKAEAKISLIMLELASNPLMRLMSTKMGGDPLLFALLWPHQHIATHAIPTAATDGRVFYWNVAFINSLSLIGLRLVMCHEAIHAIYQHGNRRGARHPKLWNICVDFIANGFVMADLKYRGFDPHSYFTKHLGIYITLAETIELYTDPLKFAIKKGWRVEDLPKADLNKSSYAVIDPEKEVEPIEKKEKITFFYADPTLTDNDLRPEKIYEQLIKVIPRCPECGRLGVYYLPDQHSSDDKNAGKGDGKDSKGGCKSCAQGVDVFDLGGEVDEHIEVVESEEKMAQNLANAINTAKAMAGNIPKGVETELGLLTEPKVKWQDVVLNQMHRARQGNSRNDYTRFKSRQLFASLLVPKKKGNAAKFVCLFDTSASMQKEEKAFVLSQLRGLDQRAEGVIIPFDAQPYVADAVAINRMRVEDLLKVKATGGGGTCVSAAFEAIKEKFQGDFIIVLTDALLAKGDIEKLKGMKPKVPVFWVVINSTYFEAPWGKVYNLYN